MMLMQSAVFFVAVATQCITLVFSKVMQGDALVHEVLGYIIHHN